MHHDDGLKVSIFSISSDFKRSTNTPEFTTRRINSQNLYSYIISHTNECFAISISVSPQFDYSKANCLRFSIWIDQYEVTRFWIEPKPPRDKRREGVEYRLEDIAREIDGHWVRQKLSFGECRFAGDCEEAEDAKFVGKIIVRVERGLMWKGRYQSLRSWDPATDRRFAENGVPQQAFVDMSLTHCLKTFNAKDNPSNLDESTSSVASTHRTSSGSQRPYGRPYTFHFKYRSRGKTFKRK